MNIMFYIFLCIYLISQYCYHVLCLEEFDEVIILNVKLILKEDTENKNVRDQLKKTLNNQIIKKIIITNI